MKKILTGLISLVVAGILAAGVCACGYASRNDAGKWFKNRDFSSWHWTGKTPDGNAGGNGDSVNSGDSVNNDFAGADLGDFTENGITVYSAVLPRAAFAANGVSEQAENAYTLSAEVFPDYASDLSLDWSLSWQNAESEFASGKAVTDYVTITPTSDGASSAVCACLQDFGEPIVLSVTSRSNPEVSGVCVINYYQRIKACNYAFTLDGEVITPTIDNGVYKVDYTGSVSDYDIEVVPVFSNYTISDNLETTYNGALTSTFGYTAPERLNSLKIPAGLTGGDPALTENALNWCNYARFNVFNHAISSNNSLAELNIGRGLCLGNTVDAYGCIVKPQYILTAEEKLHPRCAYYISLIADNNNFSSVDAYNQALSKFVGYQPAAYNFYGAQINNYNDFVLAVKKCNEEHKGVISYSVSISGGHSHFETTLNLSYNDDFKINVQNVNLSDTDIAF